MDNTTVVDNPYGLEALWSQGDFVARGTLIILVLMSLASWYIMLTKLWDQRRLTKSAINVGKNFWTSGSVKEAVERLPKGDDFRTISGPWMPSTSS